VGTGSACPTKAWTWVPSGGGTGEDLGVNAYPYTDHYGRFTAGKTAGTYTLTVTSACSEQTQVTLSIPPLVITIDPITPFKEGESRQVNAQINSDSSGLTWSVTPASQSTVSP